MLPMGVTNAMDSVPSARRARTTPCRLLQFLACGENDSQWSHGSCGLLTQLMRTALEPRQGLQQQVKAQPPWL